MRYLALLSLLLCVANAAPLGLLSLLAGVIIPGKHIVVLKPDTDEGVLESILGLVGDIVDHVFRIGPFQGFSASLTDILLTTLLSNGDIDYIEPDITVAALEIFVQQNSPYGLARISHTTPSPDYGTDYLFDGTMGEGTCAYIIDSGIFAEHPEFEGRASQVANFADDSPTDDSG